MDGTRDLLLEKLAETGDVPEKVACNYRAVDGTLQECRAGELPSGILPSFLAQSNKYLYVQRADRYIDTWDLLLVHCLT